MPLVNSDPLLDPEGGSGTGDVVGPASSTDDHLASFDGATGKLLQDSGILVENISGGKALSTIARIEGATGQSISMTGTGGNIELRIDDSAPGFVYLLYGGNTVKLAVDSLAAERTYTFPDVSGTFVMMLSGSGAPSVEAAAGTLYRRTDASGPNDRLYMNTDGSTTWIALTFAS